MSEFRALVFVGYVSLAFIGSLFTRSFAVFGKTVKVNVFASSPVSGRETGAAAAGPSRRDMSTARGLTAQLYIHYSIGGR